MLWRRIGATALRLGDRQLARHAFEQGVKRSPTNWLCLQDLSSVLMDMADYEACLFVTERFVEYNYYVRCFISTPSNSLLQLDPSNVSATERLGKIKGVLSGESYAPLHLEKMQMPRYEGPRQIALIKLTLQSASWDA